MKKKDTEKKEWFRKSRESRIYHAPATEWEKNLAKVHGVFDFGGRRS